MTVDDVTCVSHVLGKECLGNFNLNASPVASFAVGINGAAMPNVCQGFNRCFNHGSAGFTVDCRDQANTASVMFVPRVISVACLQSGGVFFVILNKGHGFSVLYLALSAH